jgi:hypothetical protein
LWETQKFILDRAAMQIRITRPARRHRHASPLQELMQMPKIKPFVMNLGNGREVVIDSYEEVDLDAEPITLSDGTVLDNAAAEKLGNEIAERAARRRGRPSLTAPGEHSPKVAVRVGSSLKTSIEEIATREGRRMADVVRDALEEYVATHH